MHNALLSINFKRVTVYALLVDLGHPRLLLDLDKVPSIELERLAVYALYGDLVSSRLPLC